MCGGFITIDRQLAEWRYHDNPQAMSIWIHILLKANWKDGWFMGVPIPRGSLATSTVKLAEECGVDRSTVVRWLKKFEAEGQIKIEANNKFTVISVIKWADFQDRNAEVTQQMPQQVTQQEPQQEQHQVPHNRTKKQSNKEKNIYMGKFKVPTVEEIKAYCDERKNSVDPQKFFDYYESNGWKVGKNPMKDWKACVRTWEKNNFSSGKKQEVLPSYYNTDRNDKPADEADVKKAMELIRSMK